MFILSGEFSTFSCFYLSLTCRVFVVVVVYELSLVFLWGWIYALGFWNGFIFHIWRIAWLGMKFLIIFSSPQYCKNFILWVVCCKRTLVHSWVSFVSFLSVFLKSLLIRCLRLTWLDWIWLAAFLKWILLKGKFFCYYHLHYGFSPLAFSSNFTLII